MERIRSFALNPTPYPCFSSSALLRVLAVNLENVYRRGSQRIAEKTEKGVSSREEGTTSAVPLAPVFWLLTWILPPRSSAPSAVNPENVYRRGTRRIAEGKKNTLNPAPY